MEWKNHFRRYSTMPPRHMGFAFAAGLVVAAGFWVESRLIPVEYTSSALLSYQAPHEFLAEGSRPEAPTIRIAESVLSPSVLQTLADQVHFVPITSERSIGTPADAEVAGFRSHYDLEQPAPGLLQVTWRGTDQKQVVAAANALAGALAAWIAKPATTGPNNLTPSDKTKLGLGHPPTPTPAISAKAAAAAPSLKAVPKADPVKLAPAEPTAADKRKAADLQHRAATIEENLATLALQQQNIEARILARINEQKSLQRGLPKNAPATGDAVAAAQSRIAAIDKDLVTLRTLRATVVEEEASEKQEAQGLKSKAENLLTPILLTPPPTVAPQIDAAGVTPPADVMANAAVPQAPPDSTDATGLHPSFAPASQTSAMPPDTAAATDPLNTAGEARQPSWQGSFTVLTWAETAHLLADDTRQLLQWGGTAVGVLVFVAYLILAGWRFRPVSSPASVRNVLPRGIKYFGAVAGSPLVASSLASGSLPGGSITEKL